MTPSPVAMLLGLVLFGGVCAQEVNRPVSKVVTLLKDMVAQLTKEGQEDEDIYETMGCWCETNDKLKTTAIADSKQRILDLTAAIEELTAGSARLNTEIANLNKEVRKNQGTLDTATALRAKNNAEFVAEEKDMLQSIGSMKSAIVSLSKHNKGSALLQSESDEEAIDVVTKVSSVMHKHMDLISEKVTPAQAKALKAFVQQQDGYAPQSNEIFGILSAMKESFEQNLAASQKTEAMELQAFTDLSESVSEEIAAGEDQIDAKTTELGATDEKNAQSKQDLEDTEILLEEDTKFLADLKDKCANADHEFEERTKTRQLEIAAVSKALEYLSSDEAHSLFTKTFNPALVQLRAQSRATNLRRAQVLQALRAAARASSDPRLSTLAVHASMDAFGNLKKTIQTMVDRLLKEKEDEVKHKDFCVDQFNKNSRDTGLKNVEKSDTEAKIADLTATVDALAKDIEAIKVQMADLNQQLLLAGQDREKANKDFQVVVADQRATQKLLATALGVLKGFYEKAALVQAKAHSADKQAPPAGFKAYEKNSSSGGVMGMIESIITDAKEMEAEAVRGEEDSQKDYEEFVLDTNATLDALAKALANETRAKGKTEAKRLDAEVDLDHENLSLEQLASELGDIHRSCDFLMKNYEVRTAARDQEIEALKQAIALFSGAKMSAMLQGLTN